MRDIKMSRNENMWKFKRGIKRGMRTTEYVPIIVVTGALHYYFYNKGPEPKIRAVEVGVVSTLMAIGGLALINGVSVLIYNRRPNQND